MKLKIVAPVCPPGMELDVQQFRLFTDEDDFVLEAIELPGRLSVSMPLAEWSHPEKEEPEELE